MIRTPGVASFLTCLLAGLTATLPVLAEEASGVIGNFGPTGLEIDVRDGQVLNVLAVQKGSPAEGKLSPGDIITAINGQPPVSAGGDHRTELAALITAAEASDGALKLTVRPDANSEAGPADITRDVLIQLPVLGAYSETSPVDCEKTRKIIRANADFIAAKAGDTGQGLAEHNLYNGWAILMLLSTGEEQDLDVVRKVYRHRMANFQGPDTGSHSWHNGLQGIAVCEYYLRTGDDSVMPLINAICESARKYEVQGGWTHWAKGVNPQYVAGGLLNAAGTQVLTTLLLAEMCGAEVDTQTLHDSVKFFYRFAGHGSNPYGDHRPEGGYGSNNGKTEMLALAMSIAARSDQGEVYAMARDKSALSALHSYPHLLQGHTGGLGSLWYGVAAALARETHPDLYANWVEQTRWFYELSRRHDGSFGASGSGRYDQESFGYAVGLALTAPLKTLQITGAPASAYAKRFQLPAHLWGRPADLAFFSLDGGEAYRRAVAVPHVEIAMIAEADEAALRGFAAHPEHTYREKAAAALRDQRQFRLIEELLGSPDPLSRHTACMAINGYEPWGLRFSIGTRSRYSVHPDDFTPRMFESLMRIITDPEQAWWNVDNALLALAVASPQQIKSRLDDLLPWLEHEEWWLNESALIAMSPSLADAQAFGRIRPHLVEALANNMHARPRSTMTWFINRATENASAEVKRDMMLAFLEVYDKTPNVPDPEPGVDHSGITSVALSGTLSTILAGDQETILQGAQRSVKRLGDMRPRERDLQIEELVNTSNSLDEAGQKALGAILVQHYRPIVVGEDPAAFKQDMASGQKAAIDRMNLLLKIDRLAGVPGGWRLLGNNESGEQVSWHTSFEPSDKPGDQEMNRWREVAYPDPLTNWHMPAYDPAQHGWLSDRAKVGDIAPERYQPSPRWEKELLPAAGEVILTRKTFELVDLDDAMLRLTVFTRQGYEVYLNGHKIVSVTGRSKTWEPRRHDLDARMRQHLRVGTNVIAARGFLEYFRGKAGNLEIYVEALRELPSVE